MEATPDNSATLPIALSGRCPACDYDVSSLPSGRCPECGGAFSMPDAETLLRIQRAREAFLKRWRWWAAPGWAFTIAVGVGSLVFAASHGWQPMAIAGAWLAILAILSRPSNVRSHSESAAPEARVTRAFWLTTVPLMHSFWSIPLAVLLLPFILPTELSDLSTSLGLPLCLLLMLVSGIALGYAWSGLFEALMPPSKRMSVKEALLLLLSAVSGLYFLYGVFWNAGF